VDGYHQIGKFSLCGLAIHAITDIDRNAKKGKFGLYTDI